MELIYARSLLNRYLESSPNYDRQSRDMLLEKFDDHNIGWYAEPPYILTSSELNFDEKWDLLAYMRDNWYFCHESDKNDRGLYPRLYRGVDDALGDWISFDGSGVVAGVGIVEWIELKINKSGIPDLIKQRLEFILGNLDHLIDGMFHFVVDNASGRVSKHLKAYLETVDYGGDLGVLMKKIKSDVKEVVIRVSSSKKIICTIYESRAINPEHGVAFDIGLDGAVIAVY